MAMKIILADDNRNQEEIVVDVVVNDDDWEASCHRIGCAVSQTLAKRYLESKDKELQQERPPGLRSKDKRERTLVTIFGDVTINRGYYRDIQGNYHHLLDEHMNLLPHQSATPSLTADLVDSATHLSFRKVISEVKKYTSVVLSVSTVHRLLQKVAQEVIDHENHDWHCCFSEGSLPLSGMKQVPVLYTEADGVWIHLQREEKEHYQLKNGIAYEGWEHISGEHYATSGKRIYSHGDDSIPFWEGASLEWDKYWDLGYTRLIVVGGDDANWIDSGTDELGFSVRQLDAFHLARACRKGWEKGEVMYDAIRSGRLSETPGSLKQREGKTAQKSRDYVLKRLEKGLDWRLKVAEDFQIPEGARGLGTIEGNESNLFADRMKDRGMSWTIPGAQHMGKAIQLSRNGELRKWCGRNTSQTNDSSLSFDLFDELDGNGIRTGIPAREGPHAARPWVRALRNIAFPQCPQY